MSEVSIERLRGLLDYDAATGIFRWKVSQGRVKAGAIAGTAHNQGYRVVRLDGQRYLLHRLAWFYVTEQWPPHEVDHRNGIRDDNAFTNLRKASHKQNLENRGLAVNNTSGHRGVHWHAGMRKWQARVKHHGRTISLGFFDCRNEAGRKATIARENLFTHHRQS